MKTFKDYLEAAHDKGIKFVTIEDEEQLDSIFDWAHQQGKKTGVLKKKLLELNKFPVYISVDGDTVGWTDKGDRAAGYMTFNKWWIIK
jgi:hypothetical protein